MSLVDKFAIHFQDARYLGASVLLRILKKPNEKGYIRISTRFGMFLIRPSDSDLMVLRQVFIDREYDLDLLAQGNIVRATYNGILERGNLPIIIDAGANSGFSARFFASAYPNARIRAVEPDPSNAAICRENTRTFQQIEVLEAAIGAEAGYGTIEQTGAGWATRTHPAKTGIRVVTVKDLWCEKKKEELLIVKIDIEGFEAKLFSSATDWIDRACAIIVEPHDWMLPGEGTSDAMQLAMLGKKRDMLISGENLIWIKRAV